MSGQSLLQCGGEIPRRSDIAPQTHYPDMGALRQAHIRYVLIAGIFSIPYTGFPPPGGVRLPPPLSPAPHRTRTRGACPRNERGGGQQLGRGLDIGEGRERHAAPHRARRRVAGCTPQVASGAPCRPGNCRPGASRSDPRGTVAGSRRPAAGQRYIRSSSASAALIPIASSPSSR